MSSADAPSEPDGAEVSWGAAFFDFPAADGHTTPHDVTPVTWRAKFIKQRTVYGGLFRTCRTGRDWVLTTAPQAQLTLRLTPEQLTGDRWQRQLHAAQQALVTRGLPGADCATAVTVSIHTLDSDTAIQTASDSRVNSLQQAGQYISELHIRGEGFAATQTQGWVKRLLQRAAPGLSNISTLQLSECACVLPPPSKLPSLRYYSFVSCVDVFELVDAVPEQFNSVIAVLPQLSTLHCKLWPDSSEISPLISTGRQTLPGLVELTAVELTDPLMVALTSYCPNLRRIEVDSLRLWLEHYEFTGVWGVEEVGIRTPFFGTYPWFAHLGALIALARLPRPAAGEGGQRRRLRIVRLRRTAHELTDGAVHMVVGTEGLPAEYAGSLQDWSFAVSEIAVIREDELSQDMQLPALRSTLTQLRALDAPAAVVTFSGWQWSQALADVLTEALPSLSHLNITVPEVTHNAGPDAPHGNAVDAAPGH